MKEEEEECLSDVESTLLLHTLLRCYKNTLKLFTFLSYKISLYKEELDYDRKENSLFWNLKR